VIIRLNSFVSGRHANSEPDTTGTYLTDLGSTNGTVVTGRNWLRTRATSAERRRNSTRKGRFTFVLAVSAENEPAPESEEPFASEQDKELTLSDAYNPRQLGDTAGYESEPQLNSTAKFNRNDWCALARV